MQTSERNTSTGHGGTVHRDTFYMNGRWVRSQSTEQVVVTNP